MIYSRVKIVGRELRQKRTGDREGEREREGERVR